MVYTQIMVHRLGGTAEQGLFLVLSCIYDVLEEADRSLFKKISSMPGHPLYPSVPKMKESSVHLCVLSSQLPRVNTQCFKNSFLIGYFSNIELFNVIWILNVKFNVSVWNFLTLVILSFACINFCLINNKDHLKTFLKMEKTRGVALTVAQATYHTIKFRK